MDTPKVNNLISSAVRLDLENKAKAFATALEANETLTTNIETAITTNRENKLSVAHIHFSLFEMFEDEDEIMAWPRPGSEKGAVGENEPFDKYEYKDTNGTKKDGSYWRFVAKSHAVGAAILAQVKQVDDRGTVKNEFTGLSEGDAKRKKDDLNSDFEFFVTKLRQAVGLYFHMKDFDARIDTVSVDYARIPVYENGKPVFVKDANGKPTKEIATKIDMTSPKIVCVTKLGAQGVSAYFTVTNFLRLDIDKALKDGGTYEDVITSNARGTGDDENEGHGNETDNITIDNPKKFEDGASAFVIFLNTVKGDKAKMKELIGYLVADDGRVTTVDTMSDLLTVIVEHPTFKAKAEALNTGTSEPDKKAA